MENDLRRTGQMARECGLTVSALRFYDSAGVLVPCRVDPQTGYRWYSSEQVRQARLVARLRRVGMPVAEIRRVLERRDDRPAAEQILTAHLSRLEAGLADARREFSAARALLEPQENTVTHPHPCTSVTLTGQDLAAALLAVQYAVSEDPDLPMLGGVAIDIDDDGSRVVATDRYRLAVSAVPVSGRTGPAVNVIAAPALVNEAINLLSREPAPVTVEVGGDEIVLRTDARQLSGRRLDYDFPDYRRLLRSESAHTVPVDVATLRRDVRAAATRTMQRDQDGTAYEVAVLTVGTDGGVALATDATGPLQLGLNREFLLQALDATHSTELILELDGPIAPLAIRDPERAGTVSLLMPVRLS